MPWYLILLSVLTNLPSIVSNGISLWKNIVNAVHPSQVPVVMAAAKAALTESSAGNPGPLNDLHRDLVAGTYAKSV